MRVARGLLRRCALVGAGALVAVDAGLAVRADVGLPGADAWLVLADVAVGLAFLLAALWAVGPVPQRWLVAAVGLAWLAGSWLPGTRLLHQGLLVLAVAAFPDGRLRGPVWFLLVAAGAVVGLGVVPQLGVAAVLGLVAVLAFADPRRISIGRWYPVVAASGTAAVLAAATLWATVRPDSFDPSVALFGWQVVLVVVAVAFPVMSRLVLSERTRLADRILEAASLTGLRGLTEVLRRSLGDPTIRIHRYGDADASPTPVRNLGRGRLLVADGGEPLAAVEHAAAVLDDPATASAVSAAVRLMVTNLLLQEEQHGRLAELRASRVRLLAASDRVRQRVAAQLHDEVQSPLAGVRDRVASTRREVSAGNDPVGMEAQAALDIVMQELAAVDRLVATLVAGVPPTDLGGGRLAGALRSLTRDSPVAVTVMVDDDAIAGTGAETALFYVCCEALTNAVKHARASRVVMEVRRLGVTLEARVTDDGCGGADPNGSGLRGLADRVSACGGRLRVDSPFAAGTVVSAVVPR